MAFFSENLALPDNAFIILRNLIMERTGIYFEDSRKDLLADKLAERVVERGFNSFLDYYYLLKYDKESSSEWNEVIDRITVKETFFWREPDQVESLLKYILPEFYKKNAGKTFRIWSAACSTGEEPYSLLMAMESSGWMSKLNIELIASDASLQALNAASNGLYRERSMRLLPPELKERYFMNKDQKWQIDPGLKKKIRWEQINLTDEAQRSSVQVCDVIFCRNVFIYFRDDVIARVVNSFFDQLNSPGFLFTGVSESLFRIRNRFDLVQLGKTFVYSKQ